MLRIKRSVIKGGIIINAKPLFILALIESIRSGLPKPNIFEYTEYLKKVYTKKWELFYPDMFATPICKPFYHLVNDGFWNIKWKTCFVEPPATDKKLRDSVEYGYLDNTLWDILQKEENREYYESLLISYFLSDTK